MASTSSQQSKPAQPQDDPSLHPTNSGKGVVVDPQELSTTTTKLPLPPPAVSERSRLLSWTLVAVPLLLVLVSAWAYRWVQEDAFINFRIISNLLAGHGPVFNVGERVEAYSDPLWLYTLALVHIVTPFLSVEWLSVLLGLSCTAVGVVFAGRAIQRLGASRGDAVVVPVGLIVFGSVAGVWEFVTGGLEMGMVFGWLGLSFWLLVKVERQRTTALWGAFVIGLGILIRPELLLMSLVYFTGLMVVVSAKGWAGPTGRFKRYLLPCVVAGALPLLYQLWRMAYFAMVVSNTALVKAGGSQWIKQGIVYMHNFIAPYYLWLPLILSLLLMVKRVGRWLSASDRLGLVVLGIPVAAALLGTAYVTYIGGDYMHARLLLPAFFSLMMVVYITPAQLKSLLFAALAAWAIVCICYLRPPATSHPAAFDHGIANERSFWVIGLQQLHPISSAQWAQMGSAGVSYAVVAEQLHKQGHQGMVVSYDLLLHARLAGTLPVKVGSEAYLVVNVNNIGAIGYAAGPTVYVFDALSLANPIGSHMITTARTRPGHEKVISPLWMVGRFGKSGFVYTTNKTTASSIAAARQAITCGGLGTYLHDINTPLNWSQAWTDITHSLANTTLQYSADPQKAAKQLCH